MKYRKMIILTLTLLLLTTLCCTSALAAGGDVAGAVEQTWTEAAKQIKSVVEKVVFPALDMILAIAFFVRTLIIAREDSLNGPAPPFSLPA